MEFAVLLGATAGAIGLTSLVKKDLEPEPEAPKEYYLQGNGARDCEVTDWTEWTPCDYVEGSCGMGSRVSTRTVFRKPLFAGADCPPLLESRLCYRPCPVDCVAGEWILGACIPNDRSKGCGDGMRTNVLPIYREDEHGGNPCPTERTRRESCAIPCDCQVSPWSTWSPCTASTPGAWGTNAGTQSRTRQILQQSSHNGTDCPITYEQTTCNIPRPEDCQYTRAPGQNPSCIPKTEGSYGPRAGTIHYNVQQTAPARYGGAPCPSFEQEDCDLLPVNCTYEYNDTFGACEPYAQDPSCNPQTGTIEGRKKQGFRILTQASNGGTCNVPDVYAPCTIPCRVDCETQRVTQITSESGSSKPVNSWDDLVCIPDGNQACGRGTKKWPKRVIQSEKNGGTTCPTDLFDASQCEVPCPIDCVVSYPPWSEVACIAKPDSACTMEGKREGTQTRRRVVEQEARNNGRCNFPETETRDCTLDCPVNCTTRWSEWSECTLPSSAPDGTWCGAGTRTRQQIEDISAKNGGTCTLTTEEEDCTIPCVPTRFPPWRPGIPSDAPSSGSSDSPSYGPSAFPSYEPGGSPSYGPSGSPLYGSSYSPAPNPSRPQTYVWESPYTGLARVEVAGGAGGSGKSGPGGKGAKITALIRVSRGDRLTVYVGQKGGDANIDLFGRSGGGGGGASAILKDSTVLVVAGGGGGSASDYYTNSRGGNGGTPEGQDGQGTGAGDSCGKRATATHPGQGGVANGGIRGNPGLLFAPQTGGAGGDGVYENLTHLIPGGFGFGPGGKGSRDDQRGGSGGGGGGYHGGGSGAVHDKGAPGGGGSSYVDPNQVFQVTYSLNDLENGYVEFSDICDSPPCRFDCVYSDWADDGTCQVQSGQCQGKQAQTRRILIDAQNGGTACDSNQLRRELDCSVPCQPTTVERQITLGERRRQGKPGRAYVSWTYTPTRTDTLQRVRFRFSVQSNKRGCGNRSRDNDMGCDWGIEGQGIRWYAEFRGCWKHSDTYVVNGKGPFQFTYYAHDCHMFVNVIEEHQ